MSNVTLIKSNQICQLIKMQNVQNIWGIRRSYILPNRPEYSAENLPKGSLNIPSFSSRIYSNVFSRISDHAESGRMFGVFARSMGPSWTTGQIPSCRSGQLMRLLIMTFYNGNTSVFVIRFVRFVFCFRNHEKNNCNWWSSKYEILYLLIWKF